ncbi:MAG: hypothetical protein ACRDWD_15320 [Acidimicrobiia bacterium]
MVEALALFDGFVRFQLILDIGPDAHSVTVVVPSEAAPPTGTELPVMAVPTPDWQPA